MQSFKLNNKTLNISRVERRKKYIPKYGAYIPEIEKNTIKKYLPMTFREINSAIIYTDVCIKIIVCVCASNLYIFFRRGYFYRVIALKFGYVKKCCGVVHLHAMKLYFSGAAKILIIFFVFAIRWPFIR